MIIFIIFIFQPVNKEAMCIKKRKKPTDILTNDSKSYLIKKERRVGKTEPLK